MLLQQLQCLTGTIVDSRFRGAVVGTAVFVHLSVSVEGCFI